MARVIDILEELRQVRSGSKDIANLSQEARVLAEAVGFDNITKDNAGEVIAAIDAARLAEKNEEISVEKLLEVIGTEQKLDSQVPDRILLEQLLKDLDEFEAQKLQGQDRVELIRKEIERLKGKKEYQQIRDQIQKAIERKIELQAEAEAELASRTDLTESQKRVIADKVSDIAVLTEEVFVEKGIEENKREEVVVKIIKKEVLHNFRTDIDLQEAEVIIEQAVEGIPLASRKEISDIAAENLAEAVVKVRVIEQAIDAVEKAHNDLKNKYNDLSPENKRKVEEILARRIEGVIRGSQEFVEENIAIEGRALPLIAEIEEATGIKIEFAENELKEINSGARNYETANTESVRLFRIGKIREENLTIAGEELTAGRIDENQFGNVYRLVNITNETIYPDGSVIIAESKIDPNNTNGRPIAQAVHGMMRSDTPIEAQVTRIIGVSRNIGGTVNKLTKEVKAVNKIAVEINNNPKLARLFENARRFAGATKRAEAITQRLTGRVLGAVATKLGVSQAVSVMANAAAIANGSFGADVLFAIGGQILNGTFGATLTATGAAFSTGGFMAGATQLFTSLGIINTGPGAMALAGIGQTHAFLTRMGGQIAARSPLLGNIGAGLSKGVSTGVGTAAKGAVTWAQTAIPAAVSRSVPIFYNWFVPLAAALSMIIASNSSSLL